jgi:PAS domain-containing protein
MKNPINKRFLKIWQPATQGKKSDKVVQFELDLHKKLFNIFHVGDWYYMVFNLPESRFDVVSPQVETVLGHKMEDFDLNYLLNHIHPEDLPHFLNFETFLIKFFEKFSPEQISKYKMRYDYRLLKPDGSYIRILQQTMVIEHDEHGAIFRTLAMHTDISHL